MRHAAFSIRHLDLRVEPGESVALMGHNGSGKSTVLRLVAGIYQPTTGTIATNGRITAVIELGAGFHPELTGAENIHLYGAVLGLTRREILARWDEIVEFADMTEFLDTPLKYYSSGMEARLAFSVAVCLQPAILLLDEVLAVGDAAFRQR
ncbi:MAG TPA: ATP-binding cassette domain-containing protein, partial [Gemmatimonadales bacterium]|nr:ATP-binding cassette domain-containing protein [Gemmatimonadales bacterium]